jgi:hypothetical protein
MQVLKKLTCCNSTSTFSCKSKGRTKSGHRRFIEALRAGLQLRDRFPHHDIKVRAIDEAVQRTVLH